MRWLKVLFGSLALIHALPACAQDMTTSEREALSERDSDKVGRRDLLSILEPLGKVRRGMFTQLHAAIFNTRPVATYYPGVCETDQLTMYYAAAPDENNTTDAPLRPYRIESDKFFRIDPKRFKERRTKRNTGPFQPYCTSLISAAGGWFNAKDVDEAAGAWSALLAAQARLQAGTLKLDCKDLNPGASCEKVIAAMSDPSNISTVGECPAGKDLHCYDISTGDDVEFKIVVKEDKAVKGDDEDPTPNPPEVESITAEGFIIIT